MTPASPTSSIPRSSHRSIENRFSFPKAICCCTPYTATNPVAPYLDSEMWAFVHARTALSRTLDGSVILNEVDHGFIVICAVEEPR